MRQQYHFRNSENDLLVWDVFRLVDLAKKLCTFEHPLSKIKELDEEFWYGLDSKPTCKSIIEHAALINKVNLTYPIILCHEGRIMDGMHRVCKAYMEGRNHILAVQFDKYIEPDFINIDPNKLSYSDRDIY